MGMQVPWEVAVSLIPAHGNPSHQLQCFKTPHTLTSCSAIVTIPSLMNTPYSSKNLAYFSGSFLLWSMKNLINLFCKTSRSFLQEEQTFSKTAARPDKTFQVNISLCRTAVSPLSPFPHGFTSFPCISVQRYSCLPDQGTLLQKLPAEIQGYILTVHDTWNTKQSLNKCQAQEGSPCLIPVEATVHSQLFLVAHTPLRKRSHLGRMSAALVWMRILRL